VESELAQLQVRIVRYVDDAQPGWVAIEFADVGGQIHTVVDKVPIFTSEDICAESTYPRVGMLPCTVLKRWRDEDGGDLVRITIEHPLGDQSTEGQSEFVVMAGQLAEKKQRAR